MISYKCYLRSTGSLVSLLRLSVYDHVYRVMAGASVTAVKNMDIIAQLSKLTKSDLVNQLTVLGLDTHGNKQDLVQRLIEN